MWTPDEFSPNNYSSPDGIKAQRWMMVDNYGFGSPQYNPVTDLGHDVIWDYPDSFADRRAGGICAATGYWAPGHSMVWVNNKQYIIEFAPEEDRKDDGYGQPTGH